MSASVLSRTCLKPFRVRSFRCFSSSSSRDPTRSDIFYHLLPTSPPKFALSFLPTPPPKPRSATILGFLPAQSQAEGDEAGLNDFKENTEFRELLHGAVSEALREGVDELQKNAAIQLGSGWLHIHDERNVPALGRIGDPDDILASVLVEDGKIIPETYQPMPAYRLVTSDGVCQLTSGLADRLRQWLETRAKKEIEDGSTA